MLACKPHFAKLLYEVFNTSAHIHALCKVEQLFNSIFRPRGRRENVGPGQVVDPKYLM